MTKGETPVLNLLKSFCNNNYSEHNTEKALSALSRNIHWFGTTISENIHNLTEARAYIENFGAYLPEPYKIHFEECYEQSFGNGFGIAGACLTIESHGLTLPCRISAASCLENGELKLCSLHISSPTIRQKHEGCFPFTVMQEYRSRALLEFLGRSISGGILGACLEEGLPLLFINETMAKHLGYHSAEEFADDNHRLLKNCIHPNDYKMVQKSIYDRLKSNDKYQIIYRMRRKDGDYIWVDNKNKNIVIEGCGPSIISVCLDITKMMETQQTLEANAQEMEHIINSIPGGVAVYKVSHRFDTVYFSEGIPALTGYTAEQYHQLIQEDAINMVYTADVDRVKAAVRQGLKNNTDIDINFRKLHKNGQIVWVHFQGRKIGELDGYPLLHAVFHNISKETELYRDILNESKTIIQVSDLETHEILYANDAACKFAKSINTNYTGKKCYEFMMGRSEPCSFCHVPQLSENHMLETQQYLTSRKQYFTVYGKIINWNGRKASLEYVSDITQIKLTEKQLRESEQKYAICVEGAGLSVWEYDIATHNSSVSRFSGSPWPEQQNRRCSLVTCRKRIYPGG